MGRFRIANRDERVALFGRAPAVQAKVLQGLAAREEREGE